MFCPLGQTLSFLLKPQIDLILAGQILVNIPRLIAQVKNHAVSHTLIKFIGVDVCAEGFNAGLLVSLQQRSPGKANQDSVWHQHLYRLMKFAGIGTVTFVNKGYNVAFRLEVLRQIFQQFFAVLVDIRLAASVMTVLVNEGADDGILIFIQDRTEIGTAFRPAHLFFHIDKEAFDLIVKFVTVSNDDHTAVVNVLDDPLGEPNHYERLAGTLRVPNDASLAVLNTFAGGNVSEILIMTTDLLDSCIVNHKIMYKREEPLLLAKRYYAVTQTVDLLVLQQLDFS